MQVIRQFYRDSWILQKYEKFTSATVNAVVIPVDEICQRYSKCNIIWHGPSLIKIISVCQCGHFAKPFHPWVIQEKNWVFSHKKGMWMHDIDGYICFLSKCYSHQHLWESILLKRAIERYGCLDSLNFRSANILIY